MVLSKKYRIENVDIKKKKEIYFIKSIKVKLKYEEIITFCAEPKGVNVAARFMQIVIPSKKGFGLVPISLQVSMIIGMNIIAILKSLVNDAEIVEMKQIIQNIF